MYPSIYIARGMGKPKCSICQLLTSFEPFSVEKRDQYHSKGSNRKKPSQMGQKHSRINTFFWFSVASFSTK